MAWGDDIGELETWAKEDGKLPPALRDRPELDADLAPYLAAFWALCGDRGYVNSAPLAIPFTAIRSYAEMHGFADNHDSFARFESHIRALDAVFIRDRNDQLAESRRAARTMNEVD